MIPHKLKSSCLIHSLIIKFIISEKNFLERKINKGEIERIVCVCLCVHGIMCENNSKPWLRLQNPRIYVYTKTPFHKLPAPKISLFHNFCGGEGKRREREGEGEKKGVSNEALE